MPGKVAPGPIEPGANQCRDCRRILTRVPYRGMVKAIPERRNKAVECVVCAHCDSMDSWPVRRDA